MADDLHAIPIHLPLIYEFNFMTVKLYGFGRSRSFRCLWALHEAGVEHEFIAIDLFSSEANGSQSSDYLQINHQGKVPSLTHNDFTLTESAAIINYICLLYTSPSPRDRQKSRMPSSA